MKNIGKTISSTMNEEIPFRFLHPRTIHWQHGQDIVERILREKTPFLKEHYAFMRRLLRRDPSIRRLGDVFFDIRYACKPKKPW